jgi:hypothetical protein
MNFKNGFLGYYRQHTALCNVLLLLLWLLINLGQAAFMELANDEAYYWMYSRNLDFGYFDHPPAIAILIRAGYSLFQNELGVRILCVLLTTASLWLIFQLTNRKNFLLFFGIISSVGILETYGFIAVPDVPLIFFTSSFFLLYERYLRKENLATILLLGINIPLLLYSKYHGLLVLFFTVLSNLSLFKRKSFYVIVGLSLLAYLPHLLWQINNDYPSYQFHILNKSQDGYKPLDSLMFFLGQLLIAGPLTGILLFYAALRYKQQNQTEKALRFTLIGFIVFFFLSTFNAPVEPNWTAASFVPLLVLSYNYTTEHGQFKKWIIRLATVSCLFFLLLRLNLAFDFFPAIGSKALPEFYGWKSWAKAIQEKAQDKPVVFTNSYQNAAKYSFYSGGHSALSLNNIFYRRNQYDLWNIQDSLQGKTIMFIPNWEIRGENVYKLKTSKEDIQYTFIPDFRSYSRIAILTEHNQFTFPAGALVNFPVTCVNNYSKPVTFTQHDTQFPDSLVYCIFKEEKFDHKKGIRQLTGFVLNTPFKTTIPIRMPAEEGVYYLRFSIQSSWLPPGINSRLMRMVITAPEHNR